MGRQASKQSKPAGPVALPPTKTAVPCAKNADDLPPVLGRRSAAKPGEDAAQPQREEPPKELTVMELQELWEALFGLGPEDDDVERWLRSGFEFTGEGEGGSVPCPWGLKQELGGPCGVLAALQALVVRELLWGLPEDLCNPKELLRSPSAASTAASTASASSSDSSTAANSDSESESGAGTSSPPTPREQEAPGASNSEAERPCSAPCEARLAERFAAVGAQDLLACVVTRMLHAAAPASRYVWCSIAGRGCAFRREFRSAAALQAFLASEGDLGSAASPVLSFVCSLLLTRGLATVRADMDDASAPLVGVFGHCSQELTNLCLTGRATTNIFDGDLAFEDGEDSLRLKGVSGFPDVGFLSALEPLKLCEVGNFLKSPRYPLWVVGSATHYTLLFSDDCRASHVAKDKVPPEETEAPCPCCGGARIASHDKAAVRLLHYNGKDFGGEKPTLVPVEIRLVDGPSQAALLTSDQDDRLFGEVLRSRWPGAEVSYPGIGDTGGARSPPRIN